MLKIYSNENLDNLDIISNFTEIYINSNEWWMVCNFETKKIDVLPLQSSGYVSGPTTLIVADTKEELEQFIIDYNFVPSINFNNYSVDYDLPEIN